MEVAPYLAVGGFLLLFAAFGVFVAMEVGFA